MKLETQHLLAGSLHRIRLQNHRKKGKLADCTPSVSTYEVQCEFQRFSRARIADLSSLNVFKVSFQNYVLIGLGPFCQRKEMCGQFIAFFEPRKQRQSCCQVNSNSNQCHLLKLCIKQMLIVLFGLYCSSSRGTSDLYYYKRVNSREHAVSSALLPLCSVRSFTLKLETKVL